LAVKRRQKLLEARHVAEETLWRRAHHNAKKFVVSRGAGKAA
jgi:hypothetical protein